jgi:putative membrane protein
LGSACSRWRTRSGVVAYLAVSVNGNSWAVLAGASAVPATALLAIAGPEPGWMSWHMAIHIAAMNVIAPVAAVTLVHLRTARTHASATPHALWMATIFQIVLLWGAHSPFVHVGMHTSVLSAVAVHASLFLAALAFWLSIATAGSHRWQAMLALLVSGKLACLLGVLFIFAPRPLFGTVHHGHGVLLDDQHLAGLLMIAACPLSYVLTAIVLAAQAVGGREHASSLSIPEATVEQ